MNAPALIPCRCEPACVKTLSVVMLSDGKRVLTIGSKHATRSIIVDDAGRRALIEALGGRV